MHGCTGCHPELLPPGDEPQGEWHIGVRFLRPPPSGYQGRVKVFLRGVDVTPHCLEANARDGYVVVFQTRRGPDGKPERFRCPDAPQSHFHAATVMHHGPVRIHQGVATRV